MSDTSAAAATPSSEDDPHKGRDGPPALVAHVLALRADRSDRAALRRGQLPETSYVALPLLGAYMTGRKSADEASYRFAALCASFPGIANVKGQRFGQVMRRNDADRGDADGPVAKRLFVMQRQPLRIADSTFRSLLRITEPIAVDWADLYWLYLFWDHPDRGKRIQRRQQVLEQFYRPFPSSKSSDNDKSDNTNQDSTVTDATKENSDNG